MLTSIFGESCSCTSLSLSLSLCYNFAIFLPFTRVKVLGKLVSP